jgi:hypothetical protein
MIPIVTGEIGAERLSVYDRSVLAEQPLYGARVKNTTGKHLPHGPVTVYDGGAHAGDARIETLPPRQERLITYGIDLEVLVHSEGAGDDQQQAVVGAKIVDGVLRLSRRHVSALKYVLKNGADTAKRVIVVHPAKPGRDLVEPKDPLEVAAAPQYDPELMDQAYVAGLYEYYGYAPYWGSEYGGPGYTRY